jgi:hypothetical protein
MFPDTQTGGKNTYKMNINKESEDENENENQYLNQMNKSKLKKYKSE